jgi:RND family efflux transporter MFP subunit
MRSQGPAPVTTRPVKVDQVQRFIDVVGTLYGDEEMTIAAKVAGRVDAIYKEAGERVDSGAELCQISPIDYQLACQQKELASKEPLAKLGLEKLPPGDFDVDQVATVWKAKLQSDNAAKSFQRFDDLKKQNPESVNEQEWDNTKTAADVAKSAYDVEKVTAKALLAQAQSAKADLEVAKQRLEDARVCAPPASAVRPGESPKVRHYGVAARLASVGEYMKEGSAVYQLVDDELVKLRAKVPEKFAPAVKVDQPVVIQSEQVGADSVSHNTTFRGTIRYINPQVDPANRTFQVEAIIPNADRQLKAGGFVKGKILTGDNPNAVFVPLESIVTFAGVSKVFTIADGKAVEHVIETGETRDDWIEVTKGVNAGEAVIVKGASKLADGVPVSIMREGATTRQK